jgi:hypothetical protein
MPRYPPPVFFHPLNVEKCMSRTCTLRSSWELQFCRWCDRNSSVIKWGSENIVIPYISPIDGKTHRYFTDFALIIKTDEGKIEKWIVEVKPSCQCDIPVKGRKREETYLREQATYIINQTKWEAANKVAQRMGAKFIVLTEKELFLK